MYLFFMLNTNEHENNIHKYQNSQNQNKFHYKSLGIFSNEQGQLTP